MKRRGFKSQKQGALGDGVNQHHGKTTGGEGKCRGESEEGFKFEDNKSGQKKRSHWEKSRKTPQKEKKVGRKVSKLGLQERLGGQRLRAGGISYLRLESEE